MVIEGEVANASASIEGWAVVSDEMRKPYFRALQEFVADERSVTDVYPPQEQVLAAFNLTSHQTVRVVILGQDPYPNPGQANGLCFSVPTGVRSPLSLRNIYRAMEREDLTPPETGDLTGWAEQGVLLLNTALTVRRQAPGSHAKAWQEFTDAVICAVSDLDHRVVFVLWGEHAKRKLRLIDRDRHAVIEAPHPAARGVKQLEFREAHTFTRINQELAGTKSQTIDWFRAGSR